MLMCTGILPCYVILVLMRTFHIYVCHDIMWAFPFCGIRQRVSTFSLTKPDSEGTYLSSFGGSMQVCVGRVWRSTTHPTLPRQLKSSRSCYIVLKDKSHHVYVCLHYLTLRVMCHLLSIS